MDELRSVRFRCSGHPGIRATHDKTLEFSGAAEVTARATCVIGVATDAVRETFTGFRGPVTISVTAGAETDVIRAVANPAFDSSVRAVVRLSRHHDPATFAVDADKGAAALNRELVSELARPDEVVTVTISEQPGPRRPDTASLPLPAPRATSPELTVLRASGLATETYALTGPVREGPVTGWIAGLLRAAESSGAPVTCSMPDGELDERLSRVAELSGTRPVCLAVAPFGPQGLLLHGSAETVREQWNTLGRPPGDAVLVVGAPAEEAGAATAGDASPLLAALLRRGVPSRTVAGALAELPGWGYRHAYRRVLELKSREPDR